jgi:cysteine sulfinate desulfinase/cysteine desulfurase-like protein
MPTLTYLDHAATAAAHPAAVDAALRALVEPDQGAAKCLIESQKRRWGLSYGVLTSGATEANHLALERFDSERLILASPCLHPSLLAAVRLRAHDWLAVGADGCLDSQAGARQVAGAPPGTALVIDAVDGVSGAWHPWADLVCAAARAGLPVHLDASQIVGCDPLSTYPDFSLALSGHKAGWRAARSSRPGVRPGSASWTRRWKPI